VAKTGWALEASLGKKVFKYFRKIERTNHGTIQEERTRKFTVPLRILAVYRDFIPVNTLLYTALRLWLLCIRLNLASQLSSKQVVLVPVLRNSGISQPGQYGRAGWRIIRWQNRLPHRKDPDVRICVFL